MPAIVGSNLDTNFDNAGHATSTTAVLAPAANALCLVFVGSIAAAAPPIPTLSGGGMTTWTQHDSHLSVTDGTMRISLFRALQAAPGAPAAISIAFGAAQTRATWSVLQFTNVDTSGVNGAGAIVQDVVGDGASTNGVEYDVTMAAFADAVNNAAVFGSNPRTTVAPSGSAGMTAYIPAGAPYPSNGCAFIGEWKVGLTAPWKIGATVADNVAWTAIGVEVKAAPAGGPTSALWFRPSP